MDIGDSTTNTMMLPNSKSARKPTL